jgi:hypothetical protein
MCRSIKTLHNFAPRATPDEMRSAALQYVRKLAGTRKPSLANEAAFEAAVDEIHAATQRLLGSLVATSPPKDREEERLKAKARFDRRPAR